MTYNVFGGMLSLTQSINCYLLPIVLLFSRITYNVYFTKLFNMLMSTSKTQIDWLIDWSADWFCRLPAVSSVAVCRGTTAATLGWPLCCPRVLLEGRRGGISAEVPQVVAACWTHNLWSVSSIHVTFVSVAVVVVLLLTARHCCKTALQSTLYHRGSAGPAEYFPEQLTSQYGRQWLFAVKCYITVV